MLEFDSTSHLQCRPVLRKWRILTLAIVSSVTLASSATAASFPGYEQLVSGPQQVRLLPGHNEFVFTMYGTPGQLDQLQQLVRAMQEKRLGNGFDPGPAARASAKPLFDYLATVGWPVIAYPGCADMQIKGGRCVLQPEDEAALEAMDKAGLFTAIQLGEWGYYFHNLSPNERWWRDVYGRDFDAMKHLMKPPGLAGYERKPTSRRECYLILKDYFASRSQDLRNRLISVTGHSHYEAYAGEWGARCIGLELGENIAFTQSKLAFARGASRQWQKPWSVQVSPWFHGACTTSGPLRREGRDARGLDAGHSLSFYERMWLHAWFAGAAMVTPENSMAIFFEQSRAPWTLTSHGEKAAQVFPFMREHERGVPYAPVAILLDHEAGYNGYMDKPWGILEPTAGDQELRDLFDDQLFPGSDHIHAKPDPNNPEASYLRPTPYGEIFDVLLTGARPELLDRYTIILLAGDVTFDENLLKSLEAALTKGTSLLIGERQRTALGPQFDRLARSGRCEVLEPWVNPITRRSTAISNARLAQLAGELLPIQIISDPIQFQVNRTRAGWVVELVNNDGVLKRPDSAAVVDAEAIRKVRLLPKTPFKAISIWKSGVTLDAKGEVLVEVGPGASEFVEFRE